MTDAAGTVTYTYDAMNSGYQRERPPWQYAVLHL